MALVQPEETLQT